MTESTHIFGLEGLVNVGRVTENIYRGAVPSVAGYTTLRDMGIRTILNLAHGRESSIVAPYGIKEVYSPMGFFSPVNERQIKKGMDVLFNPSLFPVYVHCAQGRDRTGMVIACYRINSGWGNKDALDEMLSFGFHYVWSHFLEYVQAYGTEPNP
jgi:protein tyrosine/serine phosphatase